MEELRHQKKSQVKDKGKVEEGWCELRGRKVIVSLTSWTRRLRPTNLLEEICDKRM